MALVYSESISETCDLLRQASTSLLIYRVQLLDTSPEQKPLLAVKNVKLSEFNGGVNLSASSGALFEIEPNHPRSGQLREWYHCSSSWAIACIWRPNHLELLGHGMNARIP